MASNKRPMSHLHIPSILAKSIPQAATPSNIMAGFRVTGISPLNPIIFTESDFMPSYATDRPEPPVKTGNESPPSYSPEGSVAIDYRD
ncbi:hypothetical protein J437_LFUL019460, partial [Ladona fulva]